MAKRKHPSFGTVSQQDFQQMQGMGWKDLQDAKKKLLEKRDAERKKNYVRGARKAKRGKW